MLQALRVLSRPGLLTIIAIVAITSTATAQTAPPEEAQPVPPGLRKLTGEDARKAEELNKSVLEALMEGRWNEAFDKAEQLRGLQLSVLGPKHFETIDTTWLAKTMRLVRSMSREDQASYQSAVVLNMKGVDLNQHSKYAEAQVLLEKALELIRRVIGEEYPDTAACYMNLAGSLYAREKYVQAGPMFEKALDIDRHVLGEYHPATAVAYRYLAYNFTSEKKYQQAQPLFEKALEIRRRVFGEDHAETVISYRDLANNLEVQGKHAQVLPVLAKLIEIKQRQRQHNINHFDKLRSNLELPAKDLQALPFLLKKDGDVRLRVTREKRSDAVRDPVLTKTDQFSSTPKEERLGLRKFTGDDARKAQHLEESIATALTEGHWDEAIFRAKELRALRSHFLGPKHFETVDSNWDIKILRQLARMSVEDFAAISSAGDLTEQGVDLFAHRKYEAAQPLFEKALEIRRRVFGEDHPITAISFDYLANNLDDQGKYSKARPFYEKALEIRRRVLGEDHPDTAKSYNNLALNLDEQGKYTEAQPLFDKALRINRRVLGEDHIDTATSYNNLADNLASQSQYTQAQPLFEKSLETNRRVLGEGHPDTARAYNNLAMNLVAQGNYAEAQPLIEKALEINRRILSEDHPDTALSYNNLAMNLNRVGRNSEAHLLAEKALDIDVHVFGMDHPKTVAILNNLAEILGSQGKYARAQLLLEKALESNRRVLGDGHPNTALSYHNLASILREQSKYAEAQLLLEKSLEIKRRVLGDGHPDTAPSYNNLAFILREQGKNIQAQPLFEQALEINRLVKGEVHPDTVNCYSSLASNLNLQGKYTEARDLWLRAVKGFDIARTHVAFSGMERAMAVQSARPALAAVLARLGQPGEAWKHLEADFGRGLLDELAARHDKRLSPAEGDRLRELIAELERLDRSVETTPPKLDRADRTKLFEDLKRQRARASIALGEFQARLVEKYGALAGQVASLEEIQAALPADAALIAWVDIAPPGPNAADPDGEHWGVVVRSRGVPAWVAINGTGKGGLWTEDDTGLAAQVRYGLRMRPHGNNLPQIQRPNEAPARNARGLVPVGAPAPRDVPRLIERLRRQRLDPLARALAATADGLPAARRLIVLPSPALTGVPIEALLADDDARIVSYAPSATVFKYLREQPRPDRHAGLLALGDPVYEQPVPTSQPAPPPDRGLLVNVVKRGSNAERHGLHADDVLLTYNGVALRQAKDFQAVSEPGPMVAVEVWRDGRTTRMELDRGEPGVVVAAQPAAGAIAERRALKQMLNAARRGGERFIPLPGTRVEVATIARLFQAEQRPTRILMGADASEPELDRLAAAGELARFGFLHLATHGTINEPFPARSAVVLTQTGLPDPLQQVLEHKPVFDGRLEVREIQRGWALNAELVTLSACETALGRDAGGEGFVGFTQALLMSGTHSVCLSLWEVDDTATALLMERFYQNLLGRRDELHGQPMPKAEALREAKNWLRKLRREEAVALAARLSSGAERGPHAKARRPAAVPPGAADDRPYDAPHFWSAFVLSGDPD